MKKLASKVALIVAATRGIGLACAQELAANGAKVFLGVRNMDAGQSVADAIINKGGYAKAVLFFVSDDSSYITGQCIEVAGSMGVPQASTLTLFAAMNAKQE